MKEDAAQTWESNSELLVRKRLQKPGDLPVRGALASMLDMTRCEAGAISRGFGPAVPPTRIIGTVVPSGNSCSVGCAGAVERESGPVVAWGFSEVAPGSMAAWSLAQMMWIPGSTHSFCLTMRAYATATARPTTMTHPTNEPKFGLKGRILGCMLNMPAAMEKGKKICMRSSA